MRESVLNKDIMLFDFQREILGDDNRIVISNLNRRMGKSFLLALKVFDERPIECMYYSDMNSGFRIGFSNSISEILEIYPSLKEEIEKLTMTIDYIKIEFKNGDTTTIHSYSSITRKRDLGNRKFGLILCDECLPLLNIDSKKYFSVITTKGYIGRLLPRVYGANIHCYGLKTALENNLIDKKYALEFKQSDEKIFKRELDILDESDEIFTDSELNNAVQIDSNRIDKQLGNLMTEYESISKKENTTRTRNDVLAQIKTLIDIKDRMGLK